MTEFDYSDQSPENLRAAASTAAEAVRYLNHATLGGPNMIALEYPSDMDAVLVNLETLAQRLPQLLGQLGGWLVTECQAGRLQVASGSRTRIHSAETIGVSAVRQYLTEATVHAEALREVLHDARQVTSTLAPAPEEGES